MKSLRQLLTLLLSLLFIVSSAIAINVAATAPQPRRVTVRVRVAAGKPKLAIILVIDQFRYDYLTRFADQFCDGGFRRLMQDGAVFANAHYDYTPTVTACGHAAVATGTGPSHNGIIGNEWFDRSTGKNISSVADASTKRLGGKKDADGASPHRLAGSTIGDELKLQSAGRAKVLGVALKDRSAILPAGKMGDSAYWYDGSNGAFVSSTYYFSDLPQWVKQFNQQHSPDRFFNAKWERLLPVEAYHRSEPDDAEYERQPTMLTKSGRPTTFPHIINGGEDQPGAKFYSHFEYSPFANEQTLDFARAAIEQEKLGADEVTDLLTISLSANDLVGHYFGPYSQEVQDMTLRTDRQLADFFNWLHQKVGLQNVVLAMTADHGVAPVPEHSMKRGLGGRVPMKEVGDSINSALASRFGEENLMLKLVSGNVYLNYEAMEKRNLSRSEVEKFIAETLTRHPSIAAAFTRSQLLSGELPHTKIAESVVRGFYAERNGDVIIVPKPYWLISDSDSATSHSTPYSYDTHVPVLFWGAGVSAGRYFNPACPTDIAPTLSALLELTPPSNSTGRVLTQAIKASQNR
jgi:predicted AlkP superfamily pyrophosphatase or phosphodiesterase